MVYQDPAPGSPSYGSTTDVAKEQAGRVGQRATEAGGQVAQTTKDQAQQVVGEVKQQARDLVGEARAQVRDQAGSQRDRAVQGLRTLSDELDQMAYQGGQSGLATEVARQVSSRIRDLAGNLERHEPSDLLEQVRAYARRRPVVFLAGAALAGVAAGRLTKSLAAGAPDTGSRALTSGYGYGDGYTTAEPLAVDSGTYAASGYQTDTGYQSGTGYDAGYSAPAYGTTGAASGGNGYETAPPEDYGTTAGGFREPDAGATDGGYGDTGTAGYPPATPYEPVPEPDQPPRGWTS